MSRIYRPRLVGLDAKYGGFLRRAVDASKDGRSIGGYGSRIAKEVLHTKSLKPTGPGIRWILNRWSNNMERR